MAEFKRSGRDGCHNPIRVYPRFWGSLDLSEQRLGHYEGLLDHLVAKEGLRVATPSQVEYWEWSRPRYPAPA